jgi:hypothetical protein
MPRSLEISKEAALSFRDQLREARLKAQADAEAFEEIVFVLERLGCYLRKEQGSLGRYEKYIVRLASRSPLFHTVPDAFRELHIPFPILYDRVRQARNDAMHGGAAARYATAHAVELAVVLEDALMNGYDKVSDFMVRNVICAELWQPLSFIRQIMLASSFSCLPVKAVHDGKPLWELVSDKALAQYLRCVSNGGLLKDLLVQPLGEAKGNGMILPVARTCVATDPVRDVLAGWDGQPVLVVRQNKGELLGILTPYDLL